MDSETIRYPRGRISLNLIALKAKFIQTMLFLSIAFLLADFNNVLFDLQSSLFLIIINDLI